MLNSDPWTNEYDALDAGTDSALQGTLCGRNSDTGSVSARCWIQLPPSVFR